MKSNYPPGSANDPKAPWNEKEAKDCQHCSGFGCEDCDDSGIQKDDDDWGLEDWGEDEK